MDTTSQTGLKGRDVSDMKTTKKILVICGTGIATSTVVANKIRNYLGSKSDMPRVEISQGKVVDLLKGTDADLIVATTQVPSSIQVPVVNAVPLLIGSGTEVLRKIEEELRKL